MKQSDNPVDKDEGQWQSCWQGEEEMLDHFENAVLLEANKENATDLAPPTLYILHHMHRFSVVGASLLKK